MIKKYVTTVTTEWELRGSVTPEMINDRLRTALNIVMMTGGSVDYAFTGSDHLLELKTTEAPERFIPKEVRDQMLQDDSFLWDYAHTTFTGDGMDQEHAAELLEGEDDEFLLECYFQWSSHDEDLGKKLEAELRALGNKRINKILDEGRN